MAVDGIKLFNVWHAALLCYLYGFETLYQICDNGDRTTTYSFAVPSLDAQGDIASYEAGTMTLGDAHSFVSAFNQIVQTQKRFRSQGDDQWCSPQWIRGEIQVG